MIATIGYVKLIVVVDCQGAGSHELAGLEAVSAPLANPGAFGREDLNTVVVAIFTDVKLALSVDDNIGRVSEQSRCVALNALADLLQELAVTIINHDPVKVRVCHQNAAQTINRQATWAIDIEGGHGPVVDIFAVAVEDLDPVGQVCNIKLVIGIKRSHPGLGKPAWPGSTNTPDELRGISGEIAAAVMSRCKGCSNQALDELPTRACFRA